MNGAAVQIMDTIRCGKGNVSKKDIQRLTGLSWGTMCKCTDQLIENGYIFARREKAQGRGRRRFHFASTVTPPIISASISARRARARPSAICLSIRSICTKRRRRVSKEKRSLTFFLSESLIRRSAFRGSSGVAWRESGSPCPVTWILKTVLSCRDAISAFPGERICGLPILSARNTLLLSMR